MDKPIPKEAVVRLCGGQMIEVFTSTNNANELANKVLPEYGTHYPAAERLDGGHLLVVSPFYKLEEVYLYLKDLFE